MKQDRDDLLRHLRDQVGFITRSSEAFDNGHTSEAKRIAVALRILLHDKGENKSLLGQLGMKGFDFYSTAKEINPANMLTEFHLVGIVWPKTGARFSAPLDANPLKEKAWVPFDDWWNQPILRDNQRRHVTRKELILWMANNDGGAHVDPNLNETYGDLTRGGSLGVCAAPPRGISYGIEGEPLTPDPAHVSVRQMGHEILCTLKKIQPDLFEDDVCAAPPRGISYGIEGEPLTPDPATVPAPDCRGRNSPYPKRRARRRRWSS